MLLGINDVTTLPCGHWCPPQCAWAAACVLESEARHHAATLELKCAAILSRAHFFPSGFVVFGISLRVFKRIFVGSRSVREDVSLQQQQQQQQ